MFYKDIFLVYQLKHDNATRDYRFESYDNLKKKKLTINKANYEYIYMAPRTNDATLENIFTQLNTKRPVDFTGHSLSVSDIVVFRRDGNDSAFYIDNFDVVFVPEFLMGRYKYYSIQRPVDIGTFPKMDSGPVSVVKYGKRTPVENMAFEAWGYVSYDEPLNHEQIGAYELQSAHDNPDNTLTPRHQFESQTQFVGEWEKYLSVPEENRVTRWHKSMGAFVLKKHVTQEQLFEKFNLIFNRRASDDAVILAITEKQISKTATKEKFTRIGTQDYLPGIMEELKKNANSFAHGTITYAMIQEWEMFLTAAAMFIKNPNMQETYLQSTR